MKTSYSRAGSSHLGERGKRIKKQTYYQFDKETIDKKVDRLKEFYHTYNDSVQEGIITPMHKAEARLNYEFLIAGINHIKKYFRF